MWLVLPSSVWWKSGLEMSGTCWNEGDSNWLEGRNVFPTRTSQQWSQGPDRLCHLQPWRLSIPSWIKARAAWSKPRADCALGRACSGDLLWLPPELSCYLMCGKKQCVYVCVVVVLVPHETQLCFDIATILYRLIESMIFFFQNQDWPVKIWCITLL